MLIALELVSQDTRGVLLLDRGRCCTRVGAPRDGMVAGVWWACLEGVGLRVESARAVVAYAVALVGVFVRVFLEALGVRRGVGCTGWADKDWAMGAGGEGSGGKMVRAGEG